MRGKRKLVGHRRRVPRLWCIPPAMMRDPADRLEGDRILTESPSDLGLLLWRAARHVTLWATTPEETRGLLFTDGTAKARFALVTAMDLPDKLSAPVDTLHAQLAEPGRADAEIVALSCLEVAAWAHRAGLVHTAVAMAQAGALAAPGFGEAALHVGVYARTAGQGPRAETWLRRAIAVAHRERDQVAYPCALAELAALYESRGSTHRAERYYQRSCGAARRYGARVARMRAAHGLFRIARQQGDDARAAQFALIAQRAYERDVAGGVDLLLDLARFWTDQAEPARARAALRRLAPVLTSMPRATQLAALALTARARARWGNPPTETTAARTALALLDDEGITDGVRYAAAVDLAHAARIAGDVPALLRARRTALHLAPQAEFPALAERMGQWLTGQACELPARMERAS